MLKLELMLLVIDKVPAAVPYGSNACTLQPLWLEQALSHDTFALAITQ